MDPGIGPVAFGAAKITTNLLFHFGSAKTIKRNSKAIIEHEVEMQKALAAAQDDIDRRRKGLIQEYKMSDGRMEPYLFGTEYAAMNQQTQSIAKEINASNCIINAVDDIRQSTESLSDEPIGVDWLTRWREYASEVSDQDMQLLWGKILAGESRKPGFCSFKTMEVIRSLSRKNAEKFLQISSCTLLTAKNRAILIRHADGNYWPSDMDTEDVFELCELGLVGETDLNYEVFLSQGPAVYDINDRYGIAFKMSDEKRHTTLRLRVRTLTRAGTELIRLINPEPDIEYFESIARNTAQRNKIEVYLGQIGMGPDGRKGLKIDSSLKKFE